MKTFHERRPVLLGSMLGLLLVPGILPARTIVITAEDCDQMAVLSSLAPRLSWAMDARAGIGVYNSQPTLYWTSNVALLMRFPFKDLIPKDQRITKAELTVAATYVAGKPEISIRRILAEWGNGVCHQYRMVYPHKVEWAQPGARGASTDRSNKDSAVLKFAKIGEHTVDVTEDVELWYTGAVVNHGWIFIKESPAHDVYVASPYGHPGGTGTQWKLKITFEPK